mgnify:CR=1 FL=1
MYNVITILKLIKKKSGLKHDINIIKYTYSTFKIINCILNTDNDDKIEYSMELKVDQISIKAVVKKNSITFL